MSRAAETVSDRAEDVARRAAWQPHLHHHARDALGLEEIARAVSCRRSSRAFGSTTNSVRRTVPQLTLAMNLIPPLAEVMMTEQIDDAKQRQGFFAVDLGAFRCASVGGLNSALAHLLMARGTGRDNARTQWSVNSIEKRTGLSRPNADKAVKDLLKRGIWKKTRDGKHPIYEAVPGNQIPGGPFTADEQAAIAEIRGGKAIPLNSTVEALIARDIAKEQPTRRYAQRNAPKAYMLNDAAIIALTEPLAVWLPNGLIDAAAGEVPPVELIRQTRSLPALRLLIELYAVQFLPNYGGVPRDLLKGVFERDKVGEQGTFVVWGFRSKSMQGSWKLVTPFLDQGGRSATALEASFWPAVYNLVNLGLVQMVGMLLDGDDDEAEIIHPYAMRDGEAAERELAVAAKRVAESMLTAEQVNWAEEKGYHLVPVRRHIANATMVEVFRLKYRPHTSATAAWYAEMQTTTGKHLAHYQAMMTDRREISAA
jgi:hypothetical protein